MIYVVPLALIVAVFVGTLGVRKLTETEGRVLKLLSGMMMLLLGVLLAFAPELLAQAWAATAVLSISVAATAIVVVGRRSLSRQGSPGSTNVSAAS